jgi:poly(3-hydroxyalkanoate) depolymerase
MTRSAGSSSGAEVVVDHVRVQGLRLRYAHVGKDGDPLLLCSGIGANLELMLPLARAIAGVPVVLFEPPGVGDSADGWFWPSCARYARMAVGVLDALGYRRAFSVGGVSWGGALAQQIGKDYPLRVRRMILMATSPGVTMVPGKARALLRMTTPHRYLSRSFMAANAAVLYGGEMRGHPDLARTFAQATRPPSLRSYMQQVLAMLQFSSLPWLHRVRCPTLVMSGDDDPLIRLINARALAALLPGSRLQVVRGGGHLFMAARVEDTARILSEFLAEDSAHFPRS